MALDPSPRGRHRSDGASVLTYALPAGILGAALVAATARRSGRAYSPDDSAPQRAARRWRGLGEQAVTGRSVTVNRPRTELYAFWRDFANLPRFMESVDRVAQEDGRTVWTLRGADGRPQRLVTEVVSERENEHIAWRSVEGSDIETQGEVTFRDAPAGRGTHVEAVVSYRPPAGTAGRLAAMVLQEDPAILTRRELKRFKMLMETGEIATAANRRQD